MPFNTPNTIEFFRLKSLDSDSKVSQGNMKRAIDSFAAFTSGTDLSFDSFEEGRLGEWVSRQFFDGYYSKTIAYNVSKLAAIYNKAVAEGLAKSTDAFSIILQKLKEVPADVEGKDHSSTFQKIRNIFLADYSGSYERQLAKDILLFGILNGGLTLSEIINYKKDDYNGDNINIVRIVERYSKPKNKYLFPFRQGRTTVKKITRSIYNLISNLLFPASSNPFKGDPDFILTDIWCDIAMNAGITASDIKACVATKGMENPLTLCAVPSEIDTDKIADIRNQVAEAITNNPVRWYAMHLRTRLEFKDLTDRLDEKKISLDELYYPMEEIIRKVGKKKIFENRPLISWLVFYRAKATQLNSLFSEIGDIAWGYRYIRDVRSPYAVISNHEIAQYQMAIGTLSPSTVLSSDDDIKIRKGDRLVVLGGPMVGKQGILLSEKKDKGDTSGRTVYRISLDSGNSINWEVSLDSRLVKKI